MTLHDHFETLYAADDDPWDVRGTWYERRKRAVLLASLGRERYRSAFEPGCGNGEMTAALARRCDRLLACDGSASAVAAAQRRLQAPDRAEGALRLEQRSLPGQWPREEKFDLIVVSELAYYFDAAALDAMLALARANLDADGELLMCHYLPGFDDRVIATDAAHAAAGRLPGLVRAVQHRERDFLLETWRPAGAQP